MSFLLTVKSRELAERQERQAWETLSYCDDYKREIRQISPKTRWSLISVTWNNWPGKSSLKAKRMKQLKDSKDPPWTQLVFDTYTLLNTTVTGGSSVNVIKGEKPSLEREDGEN